MNTKPTQLKEWFNVPIPELPEVPDPKPKQSDYKELEAKHDPNKSQETINEIVKQIDAAYNQFGYFDFENMLDVILAFVRMDEETYMEHVDKVKEYKGMAHYYSHVFAILYGFYGQGYYDDILGQIYQSRIIGKYYMQETGTFYTPFNVALLMSTMIGPIKSSETVMDPACGTGVMFLTTRYQIHKKEGWRKASDIKFFGQDINARAVKMCKLQLLMTNHKYMSDMMYVRAMKLHQEMIEIIKQQNKGD